MRYAPCVVNVPDAISSPPAVTRQKYAVFAESPAIAKSLLAPGAIAASTTTLDPYSAVVPYSKTTFAVAAAPAEPSVTVMSAVVAYAP